MALPEAPGCAALTAKLNDERARRLSGTTLICAGGATLRVAGGKQEDGSFLFREVGGDDYIRFVLTGGKWVYTPNPGVILENTWSGWTNCPPVGTELLDVIASPTLGG